MKRVVACTLLFLSCALAGCTPADAGSEDLGGDADLSPAVDLPTGADASAGVDAAGGAADLAGGDLAAARDGAVTACPSGGTLQPGQSFTVPIDRFTGDEATTQPKGDANDGRSGDSPYFQRKNVARAHLDYWYTSSHREAGEPDPRGDQWVDYRPPLMQLGAGRYRITAQYRQTDNRASYPAQYIINHRGGSATVRRDQRQGSGYVDVDLGEFDLGCTGFVRVQDPGAESISFNKMVFRFVGR